MCKGPGAGVMAWEGSMEGGDTEEEVRIFADSCCMHVQNKGSGLPETQA